MAVRKRVWTTKDGDHREAWAVEYTDANGIRRRETFDRKKDADARHIAVKAAVHGGVHTAISTSPTVAAAGADWIAYCRLEGLERGTLAMYQQHVEIHINPRIGREKLATLTTPRIHAFRDALLADLSRAMAKKVLVSFKSILKDGQRRGTVAQNVALGVNVGIDKRGQANLQVGIDIPTPDEVRRLLAVDIPWRPLLVTAVFTGLRASELRGLRWADVDLGRSALHVRQRADRYCAIGRPKSKAGERTIPLGPMVVNTLRQWCLSSGRSELVFPNPQGNALRHQKLLSHALVPAMLAADIVTTDGTAKYTGLHSLRHFYASWCINRRNEGGLELSPKLVQQRLGHASITLTMDRYGHLFPRNDDGAELVAAERLLLA